MRYSFRKTAALALAGALCIALCGCGGADNKTQADASYADGVYEGRSTDFEADESGNGAGYGEVTVEIKDQKIISCTFTLYELDGKVKDETYGADLSRENRMKAQKAVQAADKYAAKLVEVGSLEGVDTITGATISYNEFVEAVNDALAKAAQ